MSLENALEDHIEAALITWINAVGTHGKDFSLYSVRSEEEDYTDTKVLPAIVVKANRDTEEIGTGVWQCTVTIRMESQADDTTDAVRKQAWSDLIAIIYRDDIASKIAISSTIACYGVVFQNPTDRTEEDRHYSNTITFNCWAYSI